MSVKQFVSLTAAKIAVVLILFASAPAIGATFDCSGESPDVTGDVSPNNGCQFSDTLGPSQPTLAEINAEGFFDINDWVELGKVDTDDSNPINETDGDLTIMGNNLSGTWDILNFNSNLTYLLLFKDGNNAEPGILVGYLISAASGIYDGVFSNKPDGAISNIRLLSSAMVVPLPAALPLFGTGVAVLGFFGWRRKRAIAA